MFSWFKKQDKPEITDFIYLSVKGKTAGLLQKINEAAQVLVVYYFKDTWSIYKPLLDAFIDNGKARVISADELLRYNADFSSVKIIFIEHHPSLNKETPLLQYLFSGCGVKQVDFMMSVDEPLFSVFGGEKLTGMMKTLGMSEEEAMSHKMITKSIENAQKKIDEKLGSELMSDSAEDWLRKNTGK